MRTSGVSQSAVIFTQSRRRKKNEPWGGLAAWGTLVTLFAEECTGGGLGCKSEKYFFLKKYFFGLYTCLCI